MPVTCNGVLVELRTLPTMALCWTQEGAGADGARAPPADAGAGPLPRSRAAPRTSADELSPAPRRLLEAVGLVSQQEAAGTHAAHAAAMQTPTTCSGPLRAQQAAGDGKPAAGGRPKRAKTGPAAGEHAALRPVDLNQGLGQGDRAGGRRRRASLDSTEGVHVLAGAADVRNAGSPVVPLSGTQGTVDSGARLARRRGASASPRAACQAGRAAQPQPGGGMGQAARAPPAAAPGGGRETGPAEVLMVSDGETPAPSPAASPAARPPCQQAASDSIAAAPAGEPPSAPRSTPGCSGSEAPSPSPGSAVPAPAGSDPSATRAGTCTPTSEARVAGRGEGASPCPDPTSDPERHAHQPTGSVALADRAEQQKATAAGGRPDGRKSAQPEGAAGTAGPGIAGKGSAAAPAAKLGAGWRRPGKRGGWGAGKREGPAVDSALALLGIAPAIACSAAPRAPHRPAIVDRAAAPAAAARAADTLQGQARGGAACGQPHGPPATAPAQDAGPRTGTGVGQGTADPGLQGGRARVFRPPTCRAEAEASYAFRASVTVPRVVPPARLPQAQGAQAQAADAKAGGRQRPGSPGAHLTGAAVGGNRCNMHSWVAKVT